MGKKKNLSKKLPLQRCKYIPKYWLKATKISKAIKFDELPNLTFYLSKLPTLTDFKEFLKDDDVMYYTIDDIKAKISEDNLSKEKCFAINVCKSNNVIGEQLWSDAGFIYHECFIGKKYDEPEKIANFCNCIDDIVKLETNCVVVVFCGLGINRAGYAVSYYLSKHKNVEIKTALKKLADSFHGIYSGSAISSLRKEFDVSLDPFPTPDFIQNEEKYHKKDLEYKLEKSINFNNQSMFKPVDPHEPSDVLNLLDGSLPKSMFAGDSKEFLRWKSKFLDPGKIDDILDKEPKITFEPRGLKAFLVYRGGDSKRVYCVKLSRSVHALAQNVIPDQGMKSFVLSCFVLNVDKERIMFIVDDIFWYDGKVIGHNFDLQRRNEIIYFDIVSKLIDTSFIKIRYRPLGKFSNIRKLDERIRNKGFFFGCNGITAIFDDNSRTVMPRDPLILLNFDYNGNDLAVLVASDRNSGNTKPVALYRVQEKESCLDGSSCYFAFEDREFKLKLINTDDPCDTVEDVKSFIECYEDMEHISTEKVIREKLRQQGNK